MDHFTAAADTCWHRGSGERKEKRLDVKTSELPKGLIQPVAVMPDGEGMLFLQLEKDAKLGTLYYFAFKSRLYTPVITNVAVKRVFGNVGTSGVILKLTQKATSATPDTSDEKQTTDVVGVVSG